MRVFVILLLLLALFCPAPAQAVQKADSLLVKKVDALQVETQRLQHRLDSLAIVKTQQEKLLEEAHGNLSDAIKTLDATIGMAGWITAVVGVFIAIVIGLFGIVGWLGKKAVDRFKEHLSALIAAEEKLGKQLDRAETAELSFRELNAQIERGVSELREERDQHATSRREMEEQVAKLRSNMPALEIARELPSSVDKRLSEFAEKLREFEKVGGKLTSDDYASRSLDQWIKDLPYLAIVSAESAIELDPKSSMAWLVRGSALGDIDRLKEAIVAFDKSIELDNEAPWGYYGKATTLLRLGKPEEAAKSNAIAGEKWFQRAITSAADDEKDAALRNLGYAIEADASNRQKTKNHDAFKAYRDDPDFKKLVEE